MLLTGMKIVSVCRNAMPFIKNPKMDKDDKKML
jgi:hypothetical protein